MKAHSLIATTLLAFGLAACGGGGSRVVTPTQPPVVEPPPPNNPPPAPTPPTLTVTKIMAFGDSLTEGESLGRLFGPGTHDHGTPGVPTSYPFKLQTTLTSIYTAQTIQVFNGGRGGEFVIGSGAKDRMLAEIALYQPQVMLLLHGVNNVNKVSSPDPMQAIVEAVEELVELAHARGVHVMLASLPPQRPTTKATGGARIAQFNAEIRAVAAEEGATFVDIHPAIDINTMLMEDGLHLNEAGNAKMAEVFYLALKARYHRDPQ